MKEGVSKKMFYRYVSQCLRSSPTRKLRNTFIHRKRKKNALSRKLEREKKAERQFLVFLCELTDKIRIPSPAVRPEVNMRRMD